MCYNPKHILNNSNHFSLTSPFGFDVPCGHCAECNAMKESEWFVRAWYQYQYVLSQGGVAYFYTLTFNESSIPRFLSTNIPCFDKRLVQLFIKRLKTQLMRKFKVKMDYLLTSEYGPLHQRPHHHAVFFLHKNVLPYTFLSLVESCWKFGFVQPGNNLGVVNGSSGILYVTKYITKDMSFNTQDELIYNSLYDYYSTLYTNALVDSPLDDAPDWDTLISKHDMYIDREDIISWYRTFMRDYHSHTTFYLHSNYLGYYVLHHPELINATNETVLVREGHMMTEKPLPRFIARALWYDRVPNEKDGKLTLFKLNENGIKHQVSCLDFKINRIESKLKSFFQTSRLTDFQFEEISNTSPFVFRGNRDFRFWLEHLDIDYHKMAIYMVVYRNRLKVPFFVDNKPYNMDLFNDYKVYFEYSLRDKFPTTLVPVEVISPDGGITIQNQPLQQPKVSTFSNELLRDVYSRLWNFTEEFSLYESLTILYKSMNCVISREAYRFRYHKHLVERKTRDTYKIKLIV